MGGGHRFFGWPPLSFYITAQSRSCDYRLSKPYSTLVSFRFPLKKHITEQIIAHIISPG